LPSTLSAKTSAALLLWNQEILREYLTVFGSGIGISIIVIAVGLFSLRQNGSTETILPGVIFLAFPVAIFAFYYLKAPGLQSPARYLLPSMATVPLMAALALNRLPSGRITVFMGAMAQLVVAVILMHIRIAPVLAGMRGGYIAAMQDVSDQLQNYCQDGNAVLVQEDIGVISFLNHSKCYIADGGALASPKLIGKSISEKIDIENPAFIVETLGGRDTAIISNDRSLDQIWSKNFRSHSVEMPDRIFTVRLFRVLPESTKLNPQ
jgi:hypothetical protein